MDAELGIEPSENLTELHRRILGQDPALEGSRLPPPRALTPREERKLGVVVSGREPNDSYAIEVVNPKSGKTNVIRAAGRDLRVRHDFLATR